MIKHPHPSFPPEFTLLQDDFAWHFQDVKKKTFPIETVVLIFADYSSCRDRMHPESHHKKNYKKN